MVHKTVLSKQYYNIATIFLKITENDYTTRCKHAVVYTEHGWNKY